MGKQDNLRDYLADLYQGIKTKKPNASRNPQDFRSEIESIEVGGGSALPYYDGTVIIEKVSALGWRRFNNILIPFDTMTINTDSDDVNQRLLSKLEANHMTDSIPPEVNDMKLSPLYRIIDSASGDTFDVLIVGWMVGDVVYALPIPVEEFMSGDEAVVKISSYSNKDVEQWVLANSTPTSALMPDESIIGTWVFNDSISTLGSSPSASAIAKIKFTCDGVEHTSIGVDMGENLEYDGDLVYWFLAMPSGWIDEKYKTITITEGTFDEHFVTWLKANATKVVEEYTDDSTIGTWMFNDTIYGKDIYFPNIEFTSNGKTFESMIGTNAGEDQRLYRLDYSTTEHGLTDIIGVYSMVNGWYSSDEYKKITITKGYKDETFRTFLEANATKVVEDVKGTWELNETLTEGEFTTVIDSNGRTLEGDIYNSRYFVYVYGDIEHTTVYNSDGWIYPGYKTATIDIDITDEVFISWLKSNATKVVSE